MENKATSGDHRLMIYLIDEETYEDRLYAFLKEILEEHKKICYVILTNHYNVIKEDFSRHGLSLESFLFIDLLTSYHKKMNAKNCFFVNNHSIDEIVRGIDMFLKKHRCSLVIFDNLSNLLHHQKNFNIQKLTNELKTRYCTIKKIFLMQSSHSFAEEEHNRLIKDLELFADDISHL